MEQFRIQLLDPNCEPERAHATDACFDLKVRAFKVVGGEKDHFSLSPGDTVLALTGFKIALEPGWEALVRPRSGLALKHNITVLNTPGTVDADYRGEVGVILHMATGHSVLAEEGGVLELKAGDRIAQMAVRKYDIVDLVPQEGPLDETKRGEDGFGSSGV